MVSDVDDIRELAESYSGLQYVVSDPTRQWPWGSVPAVNEIVDLVRATPGLLDRIAALEAENARLRAAMEQAHTELFTVSLHSNPMLAYGHSQQAMQIIGAALAASAGEAG